MNEAALFQTQIENWSAETKTRLTRIMQIATENLFFAVLQPKASGGRLPIDTGFLQSSFTVTLNAPDLSLKSHPGRGSYSFSPGPIKAVIKSAKPGDVIYGTFTADYTRAKEYGASGSPGFVMTNVAKWKDYVERAAQLG